MFHDRQQFYMGIAQIEMRKYEKDVDTTFIENAGRGGHSIDVS